MAQAQVIGFHPSRRVQDERTANRLSQESQESQPSGEGQESQPPEDHGIETEPRGWRARAQRIRDLASPRSHPLGSPEGRGTPPRFTPGETRSRDSSNDRRVVDALAVVIHTATKLADWALGERMQRDLVATAEESLEMAAPAAGYVLDHLPESGPLAELGEKAGLVGAGAAFAGYAVRAATGRPGGRAESEELHEAVVRRLSGGKRRIKQEAAEAAEEAAGGTVAMPEQAGEARSVLWALDDVAGIDGTGPA